jgi:hypothetical protein
MEDTALVHKTVNVLREALNKSMQNRIYMFIADQTRTTKHIIASILKERKEREHKHSN